MFFFLSTGHGSSLSLVSSSSSLYSSQEEKQAAEIRKLRKDLAEAQDKVGTLTNQLTTNVCLNAWSICLQCDISVGWYLIIVILSEILIFYLGFNGMYQFPAY